MLALTAEDEENARKITEEVDVGIPILYGLDPFEVRDKTGCHIAEDADPPYLHAMGVVLKPDGSVASATVSTGPIGRLEPEPTLGHIRYRKKNE